MNRYKIVIQYDGTNFAGFQSQKNQSGIQDKIEYSISKLNNENKLKFMEQAELMLVCML